MNYSVKAIMMLMKGKLSKSEQKVRFLIFVDNNQGGAGGEGLMVILARINT